MEVMDAALGHVLDRLDDRALLLAATISKRWWTAVSGLQQGNFNSNSNCKIGHCLRYRIRRGAHLTPLDVFLRTSTQSIWIILSAFLAS